MTDTLASDTGSFQKPTLLRWCTAASLLFKAYSRSCYSHHAHPILISAFVHAVAGSVQETLASARGRPKRLILLRVIKVHVMAFFETTASALDSASGSGPLV